MNEKIYRVRIIPGGTPLAFRQAGGGIFANYYHALNRHNRLKSQGTNAVFEEAEPVWKEVDDETP